MALWIKLKQLLHTSDNEPLQTYENQSSLGKFFMGVKNPHLEELIGSVGDEKVTDPDVDEAGALGLLRGILGACSNSESVELLVDILAKISSEPATETSLSATLAILQNLQFTTEGKLATDATVSLGEVNLTVGEGLATEVTLASILEILNSKSVWTIVNSGSAGSALTIYKAAESGKKHYILAFSAIISGADASSDILIELKSGTTVKWRERIGSGSERGEKAGMVFSKPIEIDTNTVVELSASTGGTGVVIDLNLEGETR